MNKRFLFVCGLMAAVGSLAACGGGGGGGEEPTPVAGDVVPPEVLASTQTYATWLKTLAPSETAEPLRLEGAVPPASETEEPVELD